MPDKHKCAECDHVLYYDQHLDTPTLVCPIRGNRVLPLNAVSTCKYFNYDFSQHPEKICGMCESFLGWGDWGLACRKHYYALPDFLSEACEDFTMPTNT